MQFQRLRKESMATCQLSELTRKGVRPAVIKENASKRDRVVRVLTSFQIIIRIQYIPTGRRSLDLLGQDGVYGSVKANGLPFSATSGYMTCRLQQFASSMRWKRCYKLHVNVFRLRNVVCVLVKVCQQIMHSWGLLVVIVGLFNVDFLSWRQAVLSLV